MKEVYGQKCCLGYNHRIKLSQLVDEKDTAF